MFDASEGLRGDDVPGHRIRRFPESPVEHYEHGGRNDDEGGAGDREESGRSLGREPRERRQAHPGADHVVLFDGDRRVALVRGADVAVHDYEEVVSADGEPARASWHGRVGSQVRHSVGLRGDGGRGVALALDDGSLWVAGETGPEGEAAEPRLLSEDLGGRVEHLVVLRDGVVAVVTDGEPGGPLMVKVDPGSGRELRQARLPLARLISLRAIDPDQDDLLLAVDAVHGAHLVGFTSHDDGTTLDVTVLDPRLRVTAATVGDPGWLVVARKGGEIAQVPHTPSAMRRADEAAEVCRRLRQVLLECGCSCGGRRGPEQEPGDCRGGHHCGGKGCDGSRGCGGRCGGRCGDDREPSGDLRDPHGPRDPHDPGDGPGRPGSGRGTIPDDEPCGDKRRAHLTWSVGALHRVGQHLVAVSSRGDRMAVLDLRLDVVSETFLGSRGAVLATGAAATDRMLLARRGSGDLEAWELGAFAQYVRRQIEVREPVIPPDLRTAGSMTFHGRRSPTSAPNPHLRIGVFTVTEPGQAFGDPDQAKLNAMFDAHVYSVIRDYYRENSFATLTTEFVVFGLHRGGTRRPLVLPGPMAAYFNDEYRSGGVGAVMPGDWTNPLALDGTESLTLRTAPSVGSSRDYAVPFAAQWTTATHVGYPVTVNLAGSETLDVTVVDQTGTTRALTLDFGPLAVSHAQGDDEAAFLQTLGQHVTQAVRAAETAAGSPQVLQDVVFRRIRTSDDDSRFGRLQGQLRVVATGAPTGKGRVTITAPAVPSAGLTALGLNGVGGQDGVLGSANQIRSYFAECLHAARRDAGEGSGLNDPQLSTTVTTVEDIPSRTVRTEIGFENRWGGGLARITVLSSSGHGPSGWAAATPVTGSQTNFNDRNAVWDHQGLADDVLTAAMDHVRTLGPWNPATAQALVDDLDGMMIGFVGACPAVGAPADRWSAAEPADLRRLRMFVGRHQATDLNNPTPTTPVTMGTDVVIGQRFNELDFAVMSHEIGHALGLPDLYFAAGFRDDVQFIDSWCQMAGGNTRMNHFCAWAKWALGWIVEDPNPALSRVVDVPMPDATGVRSTEAWLVPVEYWDGGMRADVEAAIGTGVPIAQILKIHLGSDGGVVDLVELRSRGQAFSLQLPPTPAVIVTNVLQPGTDRRWAVNGLYRREAHLLNRGNELTAVGDTWDFAAGGEFPVKGTRIEVTDLQWIRGGTVPICRVRVDREAAEFIDLHFQDPIPSWRSPDIWVDWPVDNPDPNVPRTYPVGSPLDQGEIVRHPSTGSEPVPHWLVARAHNAGNVHVEDVKVRWYLSDPPGAGDTGRWTERDTKTLDRINAGASDLVPFTWQVTSATSAHLCLRAEIIDWTIPSAVDPTTGDTLALSSDDVVLQNNIAQKNVGTFEALT